MSDTKLFRLSGSAPVIDQRTGHNATLRPGLVVLSEDAHTHAMATLEAECERLRAQVSALQSDANSWQSGYDKGREDGAKAAEGWKAQHARDSAELRRLCADRDRQWNLRRDAEADRDTANAVSSELRAERDALRAELAISRADERCAMGYLSEVRSIVGGDDFPAMAERVRLMAAQLAEVKASGWRNHSVNYARAEKCPQTLESAQAAWDRDQELIEEQRQRIAKDSQTINQLRQRTPSSQQKGKA